MFLCFIWFLFFVKIVSNRLVILLLSRLILFIYNIFWWVEVNNFGWNIVFFCLIDFFIFIEFNNLFFVIFRGIWIKGVGIIFVDIFFVLGLGFFFKICLFYFLG